MVEKECLRWASKGINIRYQTRITRGGYKAGALKEGLTHDYVQDCEYVAIFDADFRPEPDFLLRSIPFLIHNPEIALIQARWRFGKHPICVIFYTKKKDVILTFFVHFLFSFFPFLVYACIFATNMTCVLLPKKKKKILLPFPFLCFLLSGVVVLIPCCNGAMEIPSITDGGTTTIHNYSIHSLEYCLCLG